MSNATLRLFSSQASVTCEKFNTSFATEPTEITEDKLPEQRVLYGTISHLLATKLISLCLTLWRKFGNTATSQLKNDCESALMGLVKRKWQSGSEIILTTGSPLENCTYEPRRRVTGSW